MPLMGRRRLAPKCTMLPQKQGRLERVHDGFISAVDQRLIKHGYTGNSIRSLFGAFFQS